MAINKGTARTALAKFLNTDRSKVPLPDWCPKPGSLYRWRAGKGDVLELEWGASSSEFRLIDSTHEWVILCGDLLGRNLAHAFLAARQGRTVER